MYAIPPGLPKRGALRILIADDDVVARRTFRQLLVAHGVCHVHQNGRETLAAFDDAQHSGHPFHLVCIGLTHESMPAERLMGEIRHRERIWGLSDFQRTRALVVTDDERAAYLRTNLRDGRTAAIARPVTPDSVVGALLVLGIMDLEQDAEPDVFARPWYSSARLVESTP